MERPTLKILYFLYLKIFVLRKVLHLVTALKIILTKENTPADRRTDYYFDKKCMHESGYDRGASLKSGPIFDLSKFI